MPIVNLTVEEIEAVLICIGSASERVESGADGDFKTSVEAAGTASMKLVRAKYQKRRAARSKSG